MNCVFIKNFAQTQIELWLKTKIYWKYLNLSVNYIIYSIIVYIPRGITNVLLEFRGEKVYYTCFTII